MTNRSWLDWTPSSKNLPACPENHPTKPTKSISVSSVGSSMEQDHGCTADSVTTECTDKTDKNLTPEEAEAVQLLNLAGCRIMRTDSGLQIGLWEDLDTPELRAAQRVTGLDVHPVVHLESAEAPIRYKVRSCPDRNPGESFAAWRQRALAEAQRRWGWTAQLYPSTST